MHGRSLQSIFEEQRSDDANYCEDHYRHVQCEEDCEKWAHLMQDMASSLLQPLSSLIFWIGDAHRHYCATWLKRLSKVLLSTALPLPPVAKSNRGVPQTSCFLKAFRYRMGMISQQLYHPVRRNEQLRYCGSRSLESVGRSQCNVSNRNNITNFVNKLGRHRN